MKKTSDILEMANRFAEFAHQIAHPYVLLAAVAVAVPVMWRCKSVFYGDAGELASDTVDAGASSWFDDGWLSADDRWAALKLCVFLGLSLGFTVGLYRIALMVFY